jgi:DeoR/GlpR family transcriptional regulator of sugar metabolism
MTKEEMVEMIERLQKENEALVIKVGAKEKGRKDEVLSLIREKGRITIKELAAAIGISERNISSQLSYLRKDGLKFGKNSKGAIYEEKDE